MRNTTRPIARRARAYSISVGLMFGLTTVPAGATVRATVGGIWLTPSETSVYDPTSASLTRSLPPALSGTASADSRLGTLKDYAEGIVIKNVNSTGPSIYQSFGADAASYIDDTFRFQNYLPGQVATLYFAVHGSFVDNRAAEDAGATIGNGAYASYYIQAYTPGGAVNQHWSIEYLAGAYAQFPQNRCDFVDQCLMNYGSGTTFGSLSLPITADPYTFRSFLAVSATGYTADFSNTARLYMSLPEGVTYTSGSGSFLSQAMPISGVPEPDTWAMMGVGLAATLCLRQLRRAKAKA